MKEQVTLHKVMLALGKKKNIKLFRNNTGVAWVGSTVKKVSGTVIIANARPLHAGLIRGSADLIGWSNVVVTPEMVGKQISIFTAIEVKGRTTKLTEEQYDFLTTIDNAGGIALLLREGEDIETKFENSINNITK